MIPDLYDLLALAGLVMLGVGLWWIWPPLGLVVPGGLLFVVGMLAAWGKVGRPKG